VNPVPKRTGDRICAVCRERESEHVFRIIDVVTDTVVSGYLCPGQVEDIDTFKAEEET
jgi:hypothetical protein